eukprot:10734323-Alexandrium_andersonii.AAC.1
MYLLTSASLRCHSQHLGHIHNTFATIKTGSQQDSDNNEDIMATVNYPSIIDPTGPGGPSLSRVCPGG